MKRVVWYFIDPNEFCSLALLPRVRLSTGAPPGLGFAWLTAWVHIWLPDGKRFGEQYRQYELLPHVWLYWSRAVVCIHFDWLRWRSHLYIWRRAGPKP
jgi:hypothetical protein